MKQLFLCFMIIICSGLPAVAQDTPLPIAGHASRTDVYKQHHKLFIKWTPSGLFPMPVSQMRFGFEYCFAGRFGAGLEGGPLTYRTGTGFAIQPEARFYFGFKEYGRAFISLEGLYRYQVLDDKYPQLRDQDRLFYYTQTSASKQVRGINAQAGGMFRVAGHLHFEISGGVGIKDVKNERQDLVMVSYGDRLSRSEKIFQNENQIISTGTMVNIVFNAKLSWLIGP